MKVLSVVFSCLIVIGAVAARSVEDRQIEAVHFQQRAFEDTINDTINSVVDLIRPYDPAHIDSVDQSILGHDISAQNIHADGFSNVFASHIKLSGLITWTLELVLEAPRIASSVEHWAVTGDQFYGDGAAKAEIDNLKISLSAKVNIFSLTLSDVKLTPSIGNADVQVTGVYNDPQLSQELSDRATQFLNDTINNSQELHDKLADIIEKIVNSILG